MGDDWYRRRAKDEASVWFNGIARKAGRGKNGSTQQGSYLVTANGDLLAFVNTSKPEHFLNKMQEGEKKWQKLKPEQKKGTFPAITNPDYKVNIPPIDPTKDLVIKVQSRALTEKDGKLSRWDSSGKVGSRATLDHLWIKQSEWTEFTNQLRQLKTGETLPLPNRLTHRIARLHLIDNTRGEGPAWRSNEMKNTAFNFVKTSHGYQIKGNFELETADHKRSFTGSLRGTLVLDKNHPTRPKSWLMTAYGTHSGEGKFTRNARPGSQPLAFTFDFLSNPELLDLIPPQHMRWQKGYMEVEKH